MLGWVIVLPRSSMTMRTMFGGCVARTTSWVKGNMNMKRAMKGMVALVLKVTEALVLKGTVALVLKVKEALVLRCMGLAPLTPFTISIIFDKGIDYFASLASLNIGRYASSH